MTESALPIFPFDTPPELDAEPEYAELRREDPVAKVRLAPGGEAYLVSRYEDVKRVFTDPVFSRAATSDPGVATLRPVRRNPYMMLSLDPPGHTRVRRLVARASTPRCAPRSRVAAPTARPAPGCGRLRDRMETRDAHPRPGRPASHLVAAGLAVRATNLSASCAEHGAWRA